MGYNSLMRKKIKALKLATFIVGIIEILLIVGFVLLSYFDWFNFNELMEPLYWLTVVSILFLINVILTIVVISVSNNARLKSDLSVADLIGSDIQESYNFGQLGLAVVDEENTIVWTNSIFSSRGLNIIGQNILEWHPELRSLVEAGNDSTITLEIGNNTYSIKYLSEAKLYIFKDITEFTNLSSYERSHAMVIGLINIDNYAEIVGSEEAENNDVVSAARSKIFEYFESYGVVVRRLRADSYFAICDFEALDKMQKDEFSLLKQIRSLGNDQTTSPTLSIGFAHDFPDPDKISEMASNALNIAMSRGGDQVVVSQYNKELRYFGGVTAAVESSSKVKIRNFADALITLIKQSKNVYVMGHANMDMDALGGCLGVYALAAHYHVPCKIIYDAKNTEKKTRNAFKAAFNKAELDNISISIKEAEDSIKASTLLVIVDVSVPEMVHAPSVLDKAIKTVVLDHHRMGSSYISQNVLSYVDPSASSSVEIMAEFIAYATANPRITVAPAIATLMLSGMFLDTNFFKSNAVGARTFDAAEFLKANGADNNKAADYLKDEYEEYTLINRIVATMKTPYYGVVYCTSDDKDIIEGETIAKVANQLMQLKGINGCFVIGRTQADEIKVSARGDGSINCQLLAEKLGGGGHFSMAAATFKDKSVADVEKILLDILEEHLAEARRKVDKEEH